MNPNDPAEETGAGEYSSSNCINIPQALKGQLEPEGTLEVSYKLNGDKIDITEIEGQPVDSAPETPMDRLKNKLGGPKPVTGPEMGM